jgi:hypothetical protein
MAHAGNVVVVDPQRVTIFKLGMRAGSLSYDYGMWFAKVWMG